MQEYQRYPLTMRHASNRPATVRHNVSMINGGPELAQAFAQRGVVGSGSAEARPDMYPDVIVRTPDDEAYYVSRGYAAAGGADPAGARRVQAAALPPNYQNQQWPRAVGNGIESDPNARVVREGEYPKYIAAFDRIVQDEEEEAALRGVPQPAAAQIDVEPERKAERRPPARKPRKIYGAPDPERQQLLKDARALGLNPFAGWPLDRLRRMIEEATAPAAE